MTDLKIPTLVDFANVEPFREDLFEKLLDQRDLLFDALHGLLWSLGPNTRDPKVMENMDRARQALDAINPEWRQEHI